VTLRSLRDKLGGLRGKSQPAEHSITVEEREALVTEYFQGYVDAGNQRWLYALAHPVRSFRTLNHFLKLPQLEAELTDSVGGQAIYAGLERDRPLIRTPIHSAATVLALPDTPEEYSLGKSKQTLRRKCRDAEKRGVTWALVTDPAERERLADLADERDRTHPRDEYRTDANKNRSLLVHPLMLAAYGADGRPILVSITPTDGQWAILQHFRILEDAPEASSARYLLTKVLAEHLIARDVRYLADNASPMGINNGLRHYQRMLGFRIYRVNLRHVTGAANGNELEPAREVSTLRVVQGGKGSAASSDEVLPRRNAAEAPSASASASAR